MFSPFARPTSAQTPTPLLQRESRHSLSFPLWLCFVRGNISRCNGCKGKIGRQGKKPLPPPDDVVLRHRETVVFQNPNTGVCIASHFCDFNAAVHIKIDEEVKRALSTVHLRHLAVESNINMD